MAVELGGVGCCEHAVVCSSCCKNGECLQERPCSCGDAALDTGVNRLSSRIGDASKGEMCETCWLA